MGVRGRIEEILREAFTPAELEVEDQSDRHRGHAGARSGGGHFRVRIVSPRFAGRSRTERHRMVYKALEDLMPAEIHALSLTALGPDEGAGS